jgi:hypothetical protein
MTDNSKLCKVCQSVISTADLKVAIIDFTLRDGAFRCDDKIIYPHHASAQDLCISAHVGCPLCTNLWDFFSNLQHPRGQKGGNDRGQASFTFSVNYTEAGSPGPPNNPSYTFSMVYGNSQLRDDYKDTVEFYAMGIESKLIHKKIQ